MGSRPKMFRRVMGVALAAGLASCGDAPNAPEPAGQQPIQPFVLSEPVASAGASPVGPATAAPSARTGEPVVFVSLPPGTAPEGTGATITNQASGLEVVAALRDGGVDPVPVPAAVGDTIIVTIPNPTGPAVQLKAAVPARRAPVVVRTIPRPGGTDVPLNQIIVVVFSEPLAAPSVGPTSIQLLQGGIAVAGTVRLLDSSHVTAAFVPTAPLQPNASYRLAVSGTVSDLDGDHLDAAVDQGLTTGSSLLGPVTLVAVSPASIVVPVGRLVQFTALLTDAASDTLVGRSVTWQTGDSTVARVAANGVNMGIVVRGETPGSTTIMATGDGVTGVAVVTVVGPLPSLSFSALSAGYDHTCGLTTGGSLYCWGENNDGQLGNGGATRSPYPTAVAGGLTAASVGTGLWRSCALTGAGAAWCWGDSGLTNVITLGTGALVPVLVPGAPVFATMVVGGTHACGLTSGGQAFCWGSNSWGQLGDPTTSGSNVPRAVAGGLSFTALSAGSAHTCGLAANSVAYCWGYNALGGLGTGTTVASAVPVPVQGGLHFVALASGYNHTCGVTADGALYCWGANGHGQLGAASAQICPGQADAVATDACSLTPLRVAGVPAVRGVGAGWAHTCALTTAGAAFCWGENTYAQLGNGTRTDSPTPVPVVGGLVFASLSSAYYHSCGLTTGGVAYCWGLGPHGELGDGATESRTAPVRVAGQP